MAIDGAEVWPIIWKQVAAMLGMTIPTAALTGATSSALLRGDGTWTALTVAVVSPTAPNRTVALDIGGTVYYLAAKITND